jgi:MATE family multidrug resistance protein
MTTRPLTSPPSGFWLETWTTLRLGLPIIFGMVLQNSLGVIDTLMVGRVGVIPVAAGSFANALFSVPLIFGFGVLGAISVFVARAAARGDSLETVKILRQGLVLALGLACILFAVIAVLCAHLAAFHQPPPVMIQARPFLLLITWSLIPMYLFQTLKQYCEALHAAWLPMVILIACVGLNVGLNWIFIYGHFGFPAMGLSGAGWATLLTRTTMLLVLTVCVGKMFFNTTALRAGLRHAPFDLKGFLNLLSVGLPIGFQVILEVSAFATAAIMMGWISETALAAHQVATAVASTTFMIPLGLSTAIAIRVSHAVGGGHPRQAHQAAQGAVLMTLVVMSLLALLIIVFAPDLGGMFVRDRRVIVLASHVLLVVGLLQIFDGIQIVCVGALRGLHDVRGPTLVTLCGYWTVGLPTAYLLAFHLQWGPVGVWSGLLTGLVFVCGCLIWRLESMLRRLH